MTALEQQLRKKILILDGAMGTMLQKANLTAADFGGEEYEGCNDYLNLTCPHIIEEIHREYLSAGADIIESNTFGGAGVVLDDYGLGHLAHEINLQGARIARQAADAFSTPDFPRFVAGSMGPTNKSLSVTGGISFAALQRDYYKQALALIKGGVDFFLVETCQDTLNVKAACLGIQDALTEMGKELPIVISGTIEPNGTTLAGQAIEAFYISLEHFKPLAVGLNCATGPEQMAAHLRTLSDLSSAYVSCYPNAGLPDEEGHYHEAPQMLADKMADFAQKGWLNIVGGCCGTTPDHIRALAATLSSFPPRLPRPHHLHAVSGIDALIYDDPGMKPLFVGERANVIGSRKFKELIAAENYAEAAEIARNQGKSGAHVIDICLANPDRNEQHDMEEFLKHVTKTVKLPFMIDSTDPEVIRHAMGYLQGKAIINSINLEEGEKKFGEIAQIVRRYGAAVVVGLIDEKGMATTIDRKLEISRRSYDLLVEKYGLTPQDLIFDPLVFPVGTGDQNYLDGAKNTVAGIRLIKENFPQSQTILGISNVSFGLPPAGREILNAVFLYHCTQAGLDYAIVNTEKLSRFAAISPAEVKMAEDLLFHTSPETLASFTAFYRDKKQEVKEQVSRPLPERLARYIVEGSKQGLEADLTEALTLYPSPLDIINGPLMRGMGEVGQLFNQNKLIVAEVLQSAEVMKAAVTLLEPHMPEKESRSKGKVLLATVKGDVHDIGKNLVDIIFSNNGFAVIDLGIKVGSGDLIEAVQKNKPQMIGLSGLLVKSAQQMILTAQDLSAAGISVPLIVGGAALTGRFAEEKIAPVYAGKVFYAKDAMAGLAIANQQAEDFSAPSSPTPSLSSSPQAPSSSSPFSPSSSSPLSSSSPSPQSPSLPRSSLLDSPLCPPPDYDPHILRFSLADIKTYLNLQVLLGHHLGLKGNVSSLLQRNDEKAVKLYQLVEELLAKSHDLDVLRPTVKYQFFPAQSAGDELLIYDPSLNQVAERFIFPRQAASPYLCLADYIAPQERGRMDSIAFIAATAAHGVSALAQKLKDEGHFLESHALLALSLQCAEASLEKAHQSVREIWGIPKQQGQRFSFGYPACPDLSDQIKLFKLLRPEDIGIELTEGLMMNPEASVTAIAISHPNARYFAV